MSTMPPTLLASSTLLGLCALAGPPARAADPLPEGVQVAYCREALNTLSLSPGINVATVAKVRFFITADGGRTWVLGAEVVQAPASSERPRFPFKVAHDGIYGVMTSVTYRDGRSEVEPRPGQPPQYALVVDSTPPAIARFEATLAGATVNRSVVHCSWSTSDANPAQEPVAIEVSSDDGAHFTALSHGAAEASCDLAIPIDPLVKQLQLRLVVSDRAGNVATSAVRPLAVTRPSDVPPAALALSAPAAAPSAAPPAPPAASAPPPAAPETAAAAAPGTPAAAAPAATPAAATPAGAPAAGAGDAASEFAQAAKALPALSDVGVSAPPHLPEIPPVPQDHPPAPLSAAPPKAAPAAPAAPAAQASAAPPAAAPAPAPAPALIPAPAPAPAATVAGRGDGDAPAAGTNAIDQEFIDRQTSRRAAPQPHILTRPLPGDEPESAPRRGRHADDSAVAVAAAPASAPAAAAGPPAAPAAPSPWLRRPPTPPAAPAAAPHAAPPPLPADGQHPPPITAAFVGDAEAAHTLGLARIAVSAGRIDDALDLYERLFASAQARAAAAEELQLLTREKRPIDLLIVTDALPRELLTDSVRLEHGRALLTLGHPDLALATLARVGSRAAEAREALLLMAHAYRALGQLKEARTALEFLARGSDGIATQAASELGRTGR